MSNGALKFRANGQTTSTVVDPRFGLGNTPTMPAGWGGGGSSAPVEGSPGTFIAPSGDTTGATDHLNLTRAVEDARDGKAPRTVYLDGEYYINKTWYAGQPMVSVIGSGRASTRINLVAGSNCDAVAMAGGAYRFTLMRFCIDGHSEGQTVPTDQGVGLNLTGDAGSSNADALGWRGGNVFHVEQIDTYYTKGDGVRIRGSVNEGRIWNCYAIRAGRYGFNIMGGTDFFAGGLSSGESGSHGIYWNGDGRLLWSKSWFSGYCPPRGVNPNLTKPTDASACGYYIAGDGPQITQCEAQDTAGYGFDIHSHGGYFTIKGDQSLGAHVRLMGSNAQIYLDVYPVAHGITTPALVHPWNGRGNHVTISGWSGRVTSGTGAKAVVQPGAPTDNDTIRTVQMGAAQKYTTYTPTLSPDYTLGGIKITLTGDIAIGNPVENINGATAEIVLTQDATGGRAVSWGSAYAGISPADTTAGKTSRWSLRCMGTKWVQTAFVSY